MWKYILVFVFGAFWASLAWYLAIRNSKKIAANNLAELFMGERANGKPRPVAPCFQCSQFNETCEGFCPDCRQYSDFADNLGGQNNEKNQN